jgi:hypothetical protein
MLKKTIKNGMLQENYNAHLERLDYCVLFGDVGRKVNNAICV